MADFDEFYRGGAGAGGAGAEPPTVGGSGFQAAGQAATSPPGGFADQLTQPGVSPTRPTPGAGIGGSGSAGGSAWPTQPPARNDAGGRGSGRGSRALSHTPD